MSGGSRCEWRIENGRQVPAKLTERGEKSLPASGTTNHQRGDLLKGGGETGAGKTGGDKMGLSDNQTGKTTDCFERLIIP